jgi:hypothetical protein
VAGYPPPPLRSLRIAWNTCCVLKAGPGLRVEVPSG